MNFKKILAAVAATAVAVSTLAFNAFAGVKMAGADVGALEGENYNFNFVENRLNYEEARKAIITFTVDTDEGFGGAVMYNGSVCGWKQLSSNNWDSDGEKDLVAVRDADDTTKYTLTVDIPAGTYGKADDAYTDGFYAQLFVQQWWGTPIYIKSVEILDAKGNPVGSLPEPPAEEEEAPADEAPADEADADEGDADEADDEATEDATDDADADDAEVDNGLVKKFAPITLNANGDKMVQYDLGALKADSVDVFTIIGKVDVADDGWVGGGGGVGYNSADGWIQIDFNIGEGKAVADDEGNMVAVLDFTELGKDTTLDTSDPKNLFQIGWWWGSGEGNIEITDIGVNGVSLSTGKAITTSLEEDNAPVIVDAPAAGDVDAATDSSKGSPDTGVADVAAVAGLAIVAAGAVIVSKKRK